MAREQTRHLSTPGLPPEIRTLLAGQHLAVLATHQQGQPHVSLVAFAADPDGRQLLFATTRTSRKYANLQADPRAAMLIDSRGQAAADFHAALALSAKGPVQEVTGPAREDLAALFLGKHPHLREFVGSPSCSLMALQVQIYELASRFQQVLIYRFAP
ncbi:MAG: pyridoxamine 5'-phosphate oxidase family protein [Desulfobacca sp.]|uniref:pyridoxamine 5'-phosphate oxidase family protein n=1 Tax=Desulfobacca sp. TaxID=2067990 RepID=UPI004049C0F3